ncbi:lytic transglycosylase domain-containing protein [Vibrio sp. 10N.261.45.A4]|uniref:lytic transglycosylase domain-containing protein n=2 Tax=unclassified Vibrio TaxID=2614977 RepID=UPI003552203F
MKRPFFIVTLLLFFSAQSHCAGRDYGGWQPSRGWTVSNSGSLMASCLRYCDAISKQARHSGVPEPLVVAVITQESGFNALAVSPKGAKGLMQLMDINSKGINPFDVEDNLSRGIALLSRLIKKYDDLPLALAAYNAGEGNVKKYGGIPPFKETEHYVNRVMTHYEKLRKEYSQ